MTAMTFTHDDIRERLVDYLYGQLEGQARAAFQAHLDACAACRVEVTGAERARAVARDVVRRPLADPVPERARARAFEAARAAVAAGALAGPAQVTVAAAPAAPPPASPASPTADEGWFSRLRRRWTWTFPTFATVAAVAVFVLVRATIFREAKSPVSEERVRELAKPAAAPGAGPASEGEERLQGKPPLPIRDVEGTADQLRKDDVPAASPSRAPSGSGARVRRAPAAGGSRHGSLQPLGTSPSAELPRGAGAPRQVAVPSAPARMASPRKADLREEQELGPAIDEDRAAASPEKKQAEPSEPARAETARANAARESVKMSAKAKAGPSPVAPPAERRDFAVPPPPPASAAAPSVAAAKGGLTPREVEHAEADVAQAPAPAPAGTEAPAATESKASKKSGAPAHSAAAPETPAQQRAADGRGAGAGASTSDPALARGSRAESLMNQRRWGEAITILRDLLRRYPSHPAAPRWRALLDAAQTGLHAPEQMFATPPPPPSR